MLYAESGSVDHKEHSCPFLDNLNRYRQCLAFRYSRVSLTSREKDTVKGHMGNGIWRPISSVPDIKQ